MGSYNM